MGEKKNKTQPAVCPVGRIFMELEAVVGKKSKFINHMNRSKVEFLKGLRALLDERIDYYEKKGSKKASAKMTKIKVD